MSWEDLRGSSPTLVVWEILKGWGMSDVPTAKPLSAYNVSSLLTVCALCKVYSIIYEGKFKNRIGTRGLKSRFS